MRRTLFALTTAALVTGALFVGCGNDTVEPMIDAGQDLAGRDLTAFDGAMPRIGCAGLVACYTDCESTSTTQAEYDTCAAKCDQRAKSGTTAKYDNALACGQMYCLGNIDAGTGKCKLSADGTRLINSDGSMIANNDPGTPPKECGRCLNDALAALFGTMCSSASSPDCMPAQCTSVTNTCLNEQ